MIDENLPIGLKGIIRKVDDMGQIHVNWENGSTLALNPKIDKFEVKELKQIDIYKIKVANDGYQLNYVPEEFKTEEICKSAVSNYGFALAFVPEDLKTEEICKIAVSKDSEALKFVPEKLKNEIMEQNKKPSLKAKINEKKETLNKAKQEKLSKQEKNQNKSL